MKVLIIQESDWLVKGPHDQHHLAEKLSLRGHNVRVIDFEILWKLQSGTGLYTRRKVVSNVTKIYQGSSVTVIRPGILKIKIPGVDYLSLAFTHDRELSRQIKEFAPDIIVGLSILNSYLAARLAKKNKIPFVYYWLDLLYWQIPHKRFRPLGKLLVQKTLKYSDVVLATNKGLRNRQIELGADPRRTHVLPHGVDFDMFNPKRVDGAQIRQQYGIGKDDTVITFVGRLSRIVGVREIAESFLRTHHPHLKFLVVGTGSREGELRQMREESGLQDSLIITGRRPYQEIPGLLAASDICVLSYVSTGLTRDIVPLKIYDYMAMRKPIISTRLPGMVEEFGENNGIVYVDRPEEILEKAVAMVKQGTLSHLGARAREFVEGRSWDNATNMFENFLVEAVRNKTQENL